MEDTGRRTLRMVDNEGARNNFIYRKQFERKLNPIFLFLTKAGLIYFIGSFYLYDYMGGGFLAVAIISGYGYNLYRNNFPYKYHQKKDIWLIRLFTDISDGKRPRTMEFNNIYPEFKFKNPLI